MSIRILILVGLASSVVWSAPSARPDGCFMPRESAWKKERERSLINEPDQKALIFFDKGKEQLIISPNYSGVTSDFAWVIPVPARPQVKILPGAPFHELARLAEPEPPGNRAKAPMGGGRAMESARVTVIERKTIGDYDISVLAATDSQALVHWLRDNGYHMPQGAAGPIAAYIKEGWTFVASKIKGPGNSSPELHEAALSKSQRSAYPTLSRLSSTGLKIYWLKETITPGDCDKDYVWANTTR